MFKKEKNIRVFAFQAGGVMETKWIGKHCKIFVRNLYEKPIIYTGKVLSINENFLTLFSQIEGEISVNVKDIILIKGEGER